MWPQITLIVLWGLSLGINMAMHGKPRENYSAWVSLISIGLSYWILNAGGFFNVLKG